jgi:hypothetical protein
MIRTMPNDLQKRAAYFHELAAHAFRAPARTTGKKITGPNTSILNRPWNVPIKRSSRRKTLIGNPRGRWRNPSARVDLTCSPLGNTRIMKRLGQQRSDL